MEHHSSSQEPTSEPPAAEGSVSSLLIILLLSGSFDFETGLLVSIVVLLILLSALVSGSEVAFFSLTRDQLKELEENPSKKEQRVYFLTKNREKLLATILIANNLFNIGVILSSFQLMERLLSGIELFYLRFLIEFVGITAVIIVFGEVLPKMYARTHQLKLLHFTSWPLQLLQGIFSPVSNALIIISNFLKSRFYGNSGEIDYDKIDQAIELVGGKNEKNDVEMIKGVVNFGNITVTEIMKARVNVEAISIEDDFQTLCSVILETGYSRIPVYEGTLDKIVGIIYAKDLLAFSEQKAEFKWQQYIRKTILIVPESKKIDDLLHQFKEKRIHMAFVVDEYGGTTGLVTMEDILEEVIGDITDEFDKDLEFLFTKNSETEYEFEGNASLRDVCRSMEIDVDVFEDVRGDSDTLAGLLLELGKRFPEKGEYVQHNQYLFTVLRTSDNRLERIQVTVKNEKTESAST